MSDKHTLEGVMDTSMKNLKEIVDSKTVIGDPIDVGNGTTIIPVSKVSFGFASGGSDFATKTCTDKFCFGGGSGAGVTLTPIAFLIVKQDGSVDLKMVAPSANSTIDKAIDMAPGIIDKIKEMTQKKKNEKEAAEEAKGAE